MAKVFIGVGHGGKDPGAAANGFLEKDLNLSIALACNDDLLRHGVDTLMSRTTDEEDTLQQEINECNAFGPALAIDIHNNGGGGDGVEAYYHYAGGLSRILAENILSEIVKIGQNSRGAKVRKGSDGRDYYGFIRQTACPAVIVECAFVDNASDLQIIDTEEERKQMGVALAKGILKTLGIPYVPLVPSLPESDPVTSSPAPLPAQNEKAQTIREEYPFWERMLQLLSLWQEKIREWMK